MEKTPIAMKLDHLVLERKMAVQCAPVCKGIKVSNILIVSQEEKESVQRIFKHHVLRCFLLFECERRAVFLVYHQENLLHYLSGNEQRLFMRKMGYDENELISILKQFANRYCIYMQTKTSFPHELGILLGYPAKDVESFILNEGHHYLYVGYWKVYHEVEKAINTFSSYDQAKEEVLRLVEKGYKVSEIAAMTYKNDPLKHMAV